MRPEPICIFHLLVGSVSLRLKRRYTPPNDAVSPPDDNDKDDTTPWVDDMRKLCVAELKRELERYDLSIVK
ncbi:hypothetical protein U1Q18_021556 [Sarracenia purpurea var. burkii]